MKTTAILVLAFLSMSAFAWLAAPAWQIADGYSIGFSCNEAAGIFRDFSGSILFDEQHPAASKFDVVIAVASINTGNGLQNQHAKSDEWFDAAKYPQIRYTSQQIVKVGNGWQSAGALEMHGVKKPLTIPFAFQHTAKGANFSGNFIINRSDFGIGKPGGEVDDQIKVSITVPVTQH